MTITSQDIEAAIKTLRRWEDAARRKGKREAEQEANRIRRVIEQLSGRK